MPETMELTGIEVQSLLAACAAIITAPGEKSEKELELLPHLESAGKKLARHTQSNWNALLADSEGYHRRARGEEPA